MTDIHWPRSVSTDGTWRCPNLQVRVVPHVHGSPCQSLLVLVAQPFLLYPKSSQMARKRNSLLYFPHNAHKLQKSTLYCRIEKILLFQEDSMSRQEFEQENLIRTRPGY